MTPHDRDVVDRRFQDLCAAYRPGSPREEQCLKSMATAEVLEERCQAIGFALHSDGKASADVHWELDQTLAAEELAKNLSKQPGVVRVQLAQTPEGADIMTGCWEGLKEPLICGVLWTAAQWSLAHDLLGTRPELRVQGQTVLDARPGQDPLAVALAVVERELARLRGEAALTARLKLDLYRRTMAMRGAPVRTSRDVRLMKRYEGMHARRAKAHFEEFQALRATRISQELKQQQEQEQMRERVQKWQRDRDHRVQEQHKVADKATRLTEGVNLSSSSPRPTSAAKTSQAPRRDRDAERAKKKAEREARKAAQRNRR